MKSISLLLIAASLAGAPVFAAEGKATTKTKTEARATAAAKAKGPRTALRWQFGSERPCDSTACRPVRFAWSPTAPGS